MLCVLCPQESLAVRTTEPACIIAEGISRVTRPKTAKFSFLWARWQPQPHLQRL